MNLEDLKTNLSEQIDYFNENTYYLSVDGLVSYIEDITSDLYQISPLNDLAKEHYTWIETTVPHWHNKTVLECLALIASEVGEAVNEARGKELTDNFKYELADIVLRVFDLAYQHNIDLDKTIKEKMVANKNRDFSKKLK